MTKDERYELGLKTLNDIHGSAGEEIMDERRSLCPDLIDMDIEWCFGVIASRKGIDYRTRELIIIASCITLGHAMPQLKAHVKAALKVGATKEEIIEVFLQMIPYAGFAAVHNGLAEVRELLE